MALLPEDILALTSQFRCHASLCKQLIGVITHWIKIYNLLASHDMWLFLLFQVTLLSRNWFKLCYLILFLVQSKSCAGRDLQIDRTVWIKCRVASGKFTIIYSGFSFTIEMINDFPVTITNNWSFIDTHCYLSLCCQMAEFPHSDYFISQFFFCFLFELTIYTLIQLKNLISFLGLIKSLTWWQWFRIPERMIRNPRRSVRILWTLNELFCWANIESLGKLAHLSRFSLWFISLFTFVALSFVEISWVNMACDLRSVSLFA